MFSCDICKIFKNTYFEEHLWIAAASLSTINFATLFSYSSRKWWFLKNAISLSKLLISCHPGNQVFIYHVYYFFLPWISWIFKALWLTLFHHNDSKPFINIMFLYWFSPFCCVYCAVFPALGFILYFFTGSPPSHIDIGVCLKFLQSHIQNPLKDLRWSFLWK